VNHWYSNFLLHFGRLDWGVEHDLFPLLTVEFAEELMLFEYVRVSSGTEVGLIAL
jgi:hypothetical protein